jgi:hypothetical protein
MTDEAPKVPGKVPGSDLPGDLHPGLHPERHSELRPEPHPELHPELGPWFDAWKTCTQNVLAQISGKPQPFELSSQPFEAADSDLRFTVVAAGAVQGEMALRLPAASARPQISGRGSAGRRINLRRSRRNRGRYFE